MSYRINIVFKDLHLDRAAIECDTVDEVLKLMEVADKLPIARSSPNHTRFISYADSLYYWIMSTDKMKDEAGRQAICGLWDGEAWASIMSKVRTEGSTWIVWWMDGVRRYIAYDRSNTEDADSQAQGEQGAQQGEEPGSSKVQS